MPTLPPLTNDELLALINGDGFYRFPASLDDYRNPLAEAQYHLIATLSYESAIHSRIAGRFKAIRSNSYDYVFGFSVYNGNRPVYGEAYSGAGTGRSAGAVFNAEVELYPNPETRTNTDRTVRRYG